MNRNLAGAPESGGRAKQHYCSEEDVHGQKIDGCWVGGKTIVWIFHRVDQSWSERERIHPTAWDTLSVTQGPPVQHFVQRHSTSCIFLFTKRGEEMTCILTYCFDWQPILKRCNLSATSSVCIASISTSVSSQTGVSSCKDPKADQA